MPLLLLPLHQRLLLTNTTRRTLPQLFPTKAPNILRRERRRTYTTSLNNNTINNNNMSSSPSPQSFHLDRAIFNEDLYAHIRATWFAGLPRGAKVMNDITAKRWWGKGATAEEKSDFDEVCRVHYAGALEAIAPGKMALPAWRGYEEERKRAGQIAGVFVREVVEDDDDVNGISGDSGKKRAMRLLSLVLLLDQMSRNIYRDVEGLKMVYGHYDRLAWSLVQASWRDLSPAPQDHAFFRGNPAWASWLSLPLMHAEDLRSQEEGIEHAERLVREAREDGDEETARQIGETMGFARLHRDIVERFGRFPHRNECLDREFRKEEEEYLKESGETFGVKLGQK